MATEYALSREGVESQFATNHLGPFLLTNLIMGKVVAARSPRVVMVASDGHRLSGIRFTDYNFDVSGCLFFCTDASRVVSRADVSYQNGKVYNRWLAYGQTKTANMLMAISLAEKLASRNLLAFSLHPGVIFTNIASHLEDLNSSFKELGMCCSLASLIVLLSLTNRAGALDRAQGNPEGWKGLDPKPLETGVSTHIYAAFDPDLAGKSPVMQLSFSV
jgi:NAD(P)-dependent dehydrogenase (short-subunit alcohol dehydrogenase family)